MIRILYLSRHPLRKEQVDELEERFGQVQITQVSRALKHGGEVAQLKAEYGADEVIATIPLNFIAQAAGMGVNVIRPVITSTPGPEGRPIYRHERFERIEYVNVVSHPLLDEEGGC